VTLIPRNWNNLISFWFHSLESKKKRTFSDAFTFLLLRYDTDRSTAERLRQAECATGRKATGTLPHATPRHRTHRCTNGVQTRRRQNSVDGIALGSFRRLRSIEDRPQESSVKSTRWESSLAGRVYAQEEGREREREQKNEKGKDRSKRKREGKRNARRKGWIV